MDINADGSYQPLNDFIEIQTIYDSNFECSITTSCFDDTQELFWTGNSEGRVTSYYSTGLSKYTSFAVKSGHNCDIKQILPLGTNEIFVLTSDALSNYSKLGVNNYKHKEVSFQNLQCIFLNQQQRFFLGGFNDFIYDFDIERLRILRQLSISDEQPDCILIKSSTPDQISKNGILFTGSSNGKIILRDSFTLKSIHKFQPHSGSLSDFDIQGNNLVSCGFSMTRTGNLCVDRFLMVYDLRMMRSMSPIQMVIEPLFLHFMPNFSSLVAVASQSGCFQLIDPTHMANQSPFYQAQCLPGLATTFSKSNNSQFFAFGHSTGSIHLFSNSDNALFNDFSESTFFVEPPEINADSFIDINHEMAPISSIPVPITNQEPISVWHTKDTDSKYRPTPLINSELTDNARVIHNIMSVPNKFDLKRNQIFNQSYEEHLKKLEEISRTTSICLQDLCQELNQNNSESINEQNSE
ncbi:unnamed protein product [Brachionus calyciflorus]|uniref:PAN2-PAN3 deadenylation complex catalytic subunit PAN2 N-terminal domain-containing protein n=1 Tax=Brachionus calyciflorus TaxID=104777 RepID=A0A814P7J7_9BILA|nr:unnamed protein product [Brachionus calyciflorus]